MFNEFKIGDGHSDLEAQEDISVEGEIKKSKVFSEEDKTEEGQKKKENNSDDLYSINDVDGVFEVILPGLISKEPEAIVGIRRERCETREEAEDVVERARQRTKENFEKISLEKSFTNSFYRINETKDGEFRVTLPGLINSKTGYYVGTTYKDFESWPKARDFFLQHRENEENLTQKPLLEIQMSENEKIAFSDFDSFNPHIAPSEKSHEIPSSVEKYLLDEKKLAGTDPSASTYQKTIQEKNWEINLYSFVSSYLKKEGLEISEQLGIEHLDSLTPKQAIELSTQIVIDLTKYKFSDTKIKDTKADQSTVLQLLREGQRKQGDHDWDGNGVCRNFASSVKAVFESLKTNQTKFNKLRDTYCLFEGDNETFAPKRKKQYVEEKCKSGHAWDTFVTISRDGDANAVIVDATWAKRNLETKKVDGLDYTLKRMEPFVYAMGEEFQETTSNKKEQLEHILSFYLLNIEKLGNKVSTSSLDQEIFFATRALDLMTKIGIPQKLPKSLVESIEKACLNIADDLDKTEFETIYEISQNNSSLDYRNILKKYLKDRQLSDYHVASFIFQDDDIQKVVFDEIKHNKDFDKFLKESPKFRSRMRELLPQLFIGFSPVTKKEDAKELEFLIKSQRGLNNCRHTIDFMELSEEKLLTFYKKVRQLLREIDSEKFGGISSGLSNYQLIKQFDEIKNKLKTK